MVQIKVKEALVWKHENPQLYIIHLMIIKLS